MQDNVKAVLSQVATCDLVKELETRLGVESVRVAPYEDHTVTVNGAAVILVVYD